jgi:hypothetical protein
MLELPLVGSKGGFSDEDQLRPHLQLLLDQHNLLIDVTIVHPTCPSHLHKSQTQL